MPKRQPDLRKLARRQRWLIRLFLGACILQITAPVLLSRATNLAGVAILIGLSHIFLWVALVGGAVLLVSAQGSHPVVTALVGFLMLAPCANFLVLLLISLSVNRTFRRADVRVGFFGVNEGELERALDPMLCRGCGYNLTGNISGVCPECGRPSPRCQCPHCNAIVEASSGMECPMCLRMIA